MKLSTLALRLAAVLTAFFCLVGMARAVEAVFIPSYWDPKRRLEKPDTSALRLIRFLTESDYPPFHFVGGDGALTGFEVDLARAVCNRLKVACSIQARRWDLLQDGLNQGQGDALIAGLSITAAARQTFDFSLPYHRSPARFIGKTDLPQGVFDADWLKGKSVGTVTGTAHAAYLKAAFPDAIAVSYPTTGAALAAMQRAEVPLVFLDGVSAALWLNGQASNGCCRFVGEAYTETRFLGEGAGIAVKKGNLPLRQAIDWALQQINDDGGYAEIYLKYFPLGFY